MVEDAKAQLIELLADGANETDAAVQDLLSRHPELRDEFVEMRALAAALEQAGMQGRRDRAAAEAVSPSSQDVERARSAVRDGIPPASPAAATRRRPLVVGLALAAAVVVIAWLAGAFGHDSRGGLPAGMILGVGDARLKTEVDTGGYRAFHWDYPALPGRHFEVRVFAVGADASPEAILRSGELIAQSWTPEPDELERLSSHRTIRWELLVFDAHEFVESLPTTVDSR